MDTTFEFLKQLDKDLRGAAARERLATEESQRGRAGGGGGAAVPFGSRRGASPAPRRRKTWAMVAAASLSVLILAGSIGFVATGGSPFVLQMSGADGAGDAPAEQAGTAASRGPAGVENQPALRESPWSATYTGFDEAEGTLNQALLPEATAPSPAPADVGQTFAVQRDLSKIVRDGRIGLVVDDGRFAEARAAVNQIAIENEGIVLSSSTQERRGTFVLRVPDRLFIETLTALGTVGRVEFEDQTGQDVTAEFVDLQARQEILLARKRVLLGFLREADTVQQTLSLYGRVEDTQLALERIQGELRFIRDQVAESTIRVAIRERAVEIETPQDIDKPSLAVAWERAVQGFLNVVAAVVIGLGYLVPIAAIGVLVWLAVRLARRRAAGA
jgi:hypothetical protein